MKKFYLPIFLLLFFVFTFFSIQKLHFKDKGFAWQIPLRLSDITRRQFGGPILSVINPEHIIFSYLESAMDSTVPIINASSINVYVRELQNGILSNAINLTNNIYNSCWPIIKTDKKGITHFVWGQSSVTPSFLSYRRPTDIYYSFYNNNGWSVPESIFHKDTTGNSNSYVNGKFRIDYKNRLHLLWWVSDDVTGTSFYHKIEENCKWNETKRLPFRSADYDFVFDKNDRMHIVYFKPEYSGGYDENSVYYRFSDDYGESWSDSVLVHKSGNQRGIKIQILADQKNNIHIIWTKHL
ncbi:hypothetical protein C0389_08125, partial [bacterium]|nr:hypothetical protein [bacterium]